MSELLAIPVSPPAAEVRRSLWPVAVVILLVVFAPALIAWGLTLLKP